MVVAGGILGCSRSSPPPRSTNRAVAPLDAASAGPGAASDAGSGVAASRFQVGGRALVASLRPDRSRFMVSEPVYARVVFEAATEPVEVELSWMGRNSLGRPENYRLTFRDAQGRSLPVPDPGPQMGGNTWSVTATQDAPVRISLRLATYVTGLTPGRYTLHLETAVRARTPQVRRPPRPGELPNTVAASQWQDLAVTLEAPVEVLADDPAALGAVIDGLGRRAVADDYDDAREAVTLLGDARDPRAIPHWVSVAQYPEYERRFNALTALRRFDDPRALAALVRAAATEPTELPAAGYTNGELRAQSARALRQTAVHGLAESPCAGAYEALLARQADPDQEVRLTVLHRVARSTGPEAAALLERFTRDASPTIQAEARRYLAERRR
ncbi:MAG: HEAT repeat domain-containing protein [Deltaproteobacteria bacterium]|nr:HEAT repeat domain-containing protein [Deltaproteobacteria bacterium]